MMTQQTHQILFLATFFVLLPLSIAASIRAYDDWRSRT